MKVIRYTLLANGTIPSDVVDGGYFIKQNGGQSPQDYDMIGLSLNWTGLENYVKSFVSDYVDQFTDETILVQDLIDDFWARQ